MDTKRLALIVMFSVLAFILNPVISGIGIPYSLLPGLFFQIWEIPTLVSFLLFGWKIGLPVAGINSFFLLAIYPSMSQPWYWLGSFVSVTSMTLGVVIAIKFMNRRSPENQSAPLTRTLPASLALGILLRVVFMTPVMVLILSVLTSPPVAMLGVLKFVLPMQAVFNVIVPFYMIPTSFLIAKVVNKNLKVGKVTI